VKKFGGVGEGLRDSMAEKGIDFAFRVAAAQAGHPIKPTDSKKLQFIQRESVAFCRKSLHELQQAARDYTIPPFDDIIGRQGDKLLAHRESVKQYQLAAAFTPVGKDGVRDFRSGKELSAQVSQDSRISLSTKAGAGHDKYSYDEKRLLLAIIAKSTSSKGELDGSECVVAPYPHFGDGGKLASVSLLILGEEQLQKIMDIYGSEFLKKLIPKEK
jgi:hypothetical protein